MYKNVLKMIGNTPIVKINNLTSDNDAEVYVKLEGANPAGSIKDRVALAMIEDAQKRGTLKSGGIIVEPTSGNTGIALAMIGQVKGYRVILTMPDTMSKERIAIMQGYGAEVQLTDGSKGMRGAIELAEHICKTKNAFMPAQFDNIVNVQAHYNTTAREIIKDMPDIDVFITGIGTGGTISGVGKALKEYNSKISVIGIEPANSAVISGNNAGAHKIQGIGAGFVPTIYDKSVVDEIMTVEDEDTRKYAGVIAKKEGLMLGISSAANILCAINLAKKLGKGKNILTISADSGYKYISEGIFY